MATLTNRDERITPIYAAPRRLLGALSRSARPKAETEIVLEMLGVKKEVEAALSDQRAAATALLNRADRAAALRWAVAVSRYGKWRVSKFTGASSAHEASSSALRSRYAPHWHRLSSSSARCLSSRPNLSMSAIAFGSLIDRARRKYFFASARTYSTSVISTPNRGAACEPQETYPWATAPAASAFPKFPASCDSFGNDW